VVDPAETSVLVIVPAWNEEATLGAVIAETRRAVPGADILIVNDCSRDATSDIAHAAGVAVDDLPINLGGGTFIWASWEDRADIELVNTNPDVIVIKTSPCALGEVFPELGHIVASRELDDGCLVADGQFTWAGEPHYVYEVV
jgi:glycosyltransferase involved in cell wall biosynthesis